MLLPQQTPRSHARGRDRDRASARALGVRGGRRWDRTTQAAAAGVRNHPAWAPPRAGRSHLSSVSTQPPAGQQLPVDAIPLPPSPRVFKRRPGRRPEAQPPAPRPRCSFAPTDGRRTNSLVRTHVLRSVAMSAATACMPLVPPPPSSPRHGSTGKPAMAAAEVGERRKPGGMETDMTQRYPHGSLC